MKIYLLLLVCAISATFGADEALREFTTANNLFTRDVYREVSKNQSGNFLVSPFSAETILSLLHSGCQSETAEELRNCLHLPHDKTTVESAIKALLPKFGDNGLYTLHTANKIYIKKGFVIKDGFKSTASQVYLADSENIDFEKNIAAAKTMNEWVEKQTNYKIKNLIESEDLDNLTRAVLINALYFKANWSHPFGGAVTQKNDFYRTEDDVVKVDTLHHYRQHFRYYKCPHLNAQFLELPFKGKEASMVVVVPKKKSGLSSMEGQLDQVFSPQHALTTTYLNVALPKFKIETFIDFKTVLHNLGVTKIFDDKQADLSGVAGVKGDLVVSKVAQKTFIDVSEEGVEAAASTFVGIAEARTIPEENAEDFVADHPFIFYVKVKDLVVFAGRVADPSKH